MNIELINTGAELMLGRVLNTHQQWICRQLADHGYVVDRQVAVDDCGPSIRKAISDALGRADLIITTGGLGPTSDDRTRDLIAELLGRPLREDPAVLEHIEGMFARRHRMMPPSTRRQALLPEGALVLPNANGTAPGLVLETPCLPSAARNGLLVMLPGPPRELRPMFAQALALIQKRFVVDSTFLCRTLRTTGLGESLVEQKIAGPLKAITDAGLEIGYCARPREVDVRLFARGPLGSQMILEAEGIVRALLGDLIFGVDEEELETVVIRWLTERKRTLAVAESCTGGLISNRLTNVPGASAVFLAGFVTYSNEAKQQFLGVSAETLNAHGAVSEATAREMAEGARSRTAANYAISVTGIAGPSGGSLAKPAGTVFIGLAMPSGTVVRHQLNDFDRETFKYVTSQQALDLLRREMAWPKGATA